MIGHDAHAIDKTAAGLWIEARFVAAHAVALLTFGRHREDTPLAHRAVLVARRHQFNAHIPRFQRAKPHIGRHADRLPQRKLPLTRAIRLYAHLAPLAADAPLP